MRPFLYFGDQHFFNRIICVMHSFKTNIFLGVQFMFFSLQNIIIIATQTFLMYNNVYS